MQQEAVLVCGIDTKFTGRQPWGEYGAARTGSQRSGV